IPFTVYVDQQQREIRQHADAYPATITVSPTVASPGDTITVSWVISASNFTGAETLQFTKSTDYVAIGSLYLNCNPVSTGVVPPTAPILSGQCSYQIPATVT